MAAPPPPPRGAMSLYADLLGGGSTEAGSGQPAPAAAKPEAAKNPALRFQPIIRRPQQNAKAKPKPKAPVSTSTLPPSHAAPSSALGTTGTAAPTAVPPPAAARPSLADWATGGGEEEEDDGDGYHDASGAGQKWPQRGGRKRKKKRLEGKQRMARGADAYVDWDELYDPARPTNMEAYLHSDERVAAAREWKGVLYAHRRQQQQQQQNQERGSESSNSSGDERPQFNSAFAPPPPSAFAPPASYNTTAAAAESGQDATMEREEDREAAAKEKGDAGGSYAAVPPPGTVPPHPPVQPQPQPQPQQQRPPPPPPYPPPSVTPTLADGLVASKPPVRFEPAAASASEDRDMGDAGGEGEEGDDYEPTLSGTPGTVDPAASEEQQHQQPRTNRPGQVGFAARLMAKYGWTRGSGLGADESGIVNPLRHKRVKGTGAAAGRIVGGDRKPARGNHNNSNEDEADKEGGASVSPVIVLRNMVEGLPDLAAEVADGQLVQEIGEECGAQYGRVERVHIDVDGRLVFIKFTEAVSALRAVNALNGRIFNGSAIVPNFYDADKFDDGVYQ